MKTLYESILDDEDVIIKDTKFDDIFIHILISKQDNIPYMRFMDRINDKYLDEIIDCFPSLKKSGYKFEFGAERIEYNKGNRIIWLEADIPNYESYKKTIFYITLRDHNVIDIHFNRHWDFGTKLRNRVNERDYNKDKENFMDKFEFKMVNFYSYIKQY